MTFKPTLYTLAHGIEVISENFSGPYVRLRVRPHPLFDGTVWNGALEVKRGRAVMTSILGRQLLKSEHVHHGPGGRHDDSPSNLSLLTAAAHNRHHKTGTKHRPESKARIGDSIRTAYAEGRHRVTGGDASHFNGILAAWREGKRKHPKAKPERNAALIEMHRETRSLRAVAQHFGISTSSANEIIRKYAPRQLRSWRGRAT